MSLGLDVADGKFDTLEIFSDSIDPTHGGGGGGGIRVTS